MNKQNHDKLTRICCILLWHVKPHNLVDTLQCAREASYLHVQGTLLPCMWKPNVLPEHLSLFIRVCQVS